MKKLSALILTICFLFLESNTIWVGVFDAKDDNNDSTLNVPSSSEFIGFLEDNGISAGNADAYDLCVLIELEDACLDNNSTFNVSNVSFDGDNIDNALKAHRDIVKNYYTEYNETSVAKLGLAKYEYYVSYYSPYVEIIFDDIAEYYSCENELNNSLVNSDVVLSVNGHVVCRELSIESTIDDSSYPTLYPLSQAFEDIGVLDASFTGNGVIVGVLDSGVPDNTVNIDPDYCDMVDTRENSHSTLVSSIIGGTTGIAAEAYLVFFTSEGGFVNKCNQMISEYNINIINMSMGSLYDGNYTQYDACVDHIVSNTGCTFIKSAGNEGGTTDYVTAPGCAMNAITVGAINYSHNIRANSSWDVTEAFVVKPDVVAPGGRICIPNLPNLNSAGQELGYSGTSLAAPMVTGTIALLMEEFPTLKAKPALVKSVIQMGAEKLPSQTSFFDQHAGFGLINYQNMRSCLLNGSHSDFIISTIASAESIVLTRNVTIPYLGELIVNANSIINSSITSAKKDRVTPEYTDYSIKIYDMSSSTHIATSALDSNVDYLIFTNNNPNNSSFRIDIVLTENSMSNKFEMGAIAYEIHSHSYGLFSYYDTRSHRKYCSCGEYIAGGHYVRQTDIVNNRYAQCLGCNALLDLHKDSANIVMSLITQVSVNGSYILSNGIVVLVDEDIQAYLDGTLVFYHPNNVPSTQ